MAEKWCEHMHPNSFVYIPGDFISSGSMWNFCPICGTPRPKEKELWEKFIKVRAFRKPFADFIDEEQAKYLANIAKDHFNQSDK